MIQKRYLNKKLVLFIYLIMVIIELYFIYNKSDLVIGLSNWENKSKEILNFKLPSDNFYGPGGAILLAPFLWNSPDYFIAISFYAILGFYFYFKICEKIQNDKFRYFALIIPLMNVYLFWLFVSSQDTVFEFAFFMAFIRYATEEKWIKATLAAIILAETRSAYWLIIILGIFCLCFLRSKNGRIFNRKAFLIIPAFILISMFNFISYGSASPALGGGMTAYFSFAKHHYLSLPKFDMDVFLSGPNGEFTKQELKEELSNAKSGAEVDRIYYKFAFRSAIENPMETVLGLMQKFESHLINIQKVPQLPGKYVFDYETNSINIQNERLNWNLVLGNLLYEGYRFFILIFGLIGLGITIVLKKLDNSRFDLKNLEMISLFWIMSIMPALLYYSETRFKIVQEVSLIPLIVLIYLQFLKSTNEAKSPHH